MDVLLVSAMLLAVCGNESCISAACNACGGHCRHRALKLCQYVQRWLLAAACTLAMAQLARVGA